MCPLPGEHILTNSAPDVYLKFFSWNPGPEQNAHRESYDITNSDGARPSQVQ